MNKAAVRRYFLNILILFSQTLNAVFLAGNPDQTISSRCWANRDKPYWKWARVVIDTIAFFDPNHCETSYARDIENSRLLLETGSYK